MVNTCILGSALWLAAVAPIVASLLPASAAAAGGNPTIMLTGYWPPSNEAVRRFSPNPAQNPEGWVGGNWEGRGYDVYAYFPEFANPACTNCGKGMGDLEVDYQDTSADFWALANALGPVAIVTHSRGFDNLSWEVEMNQYNRLLWINDYLPPLKPTPTPPDASVPAGTLRLSTLPVDAIVAAVDAADLGLVPFVCFSGDGGGFLSEFIAYHGVWYQALHAAPDDPARCVAAGHVHIGAMVPWATARLAAEETLRTVIEHVDALLHPPIPGDLDGDGAVGGADLGLLLGAWGRCPGPCAADLNGDGLVDGGDLGVLLAAWSP